MVHNLAFNFSWWSNQVAPLWLVTSLDNLRMYENQRKFYENKNTKVKCIYDESISNPVARNYKNVKLGLDAGFVNGTL